jgi:transposase
MLRTEEWMDLKILAAQGHSIRAIVEMTGLSRNTVRRALRQRAPQPIERPQRKSKIDEFKSYVEKRYAECALSAVRLVEEIRAMGYTGGVDTVRRLVRGLRAPARAQEKLTVRFETAPGQQAQADWGSLGRFANQEGKLIPIYVFVIVLGFSRYMYVEFTTSMKLAVLIGCHLRAFAFWGGWPASVLFDNMKQVKLGPGKWNPLFMDFANHYGIAVKTHRVRRPRTKGKVERMVDYVKDNFLNGRSFVDVDDLNSQGLHWLATVANVRTHATTGRRPVDLLAEEKLSPYGEIRPYQITDRGVRKVDSSGFVRWGGSRYSVPPSNTGKVVLIEQGDNQVKIKCDDLIVAEHPRADRPGKCVADPEHIQELWKLSLTRPVVPQRRWEVTFQQTVKTAPLATYEEVAQ